MRLITDYTGLSLKKNIEKCCVLSHDALLNTDGEKGFNTLNEEKDHRLLWLKIIIGNIKNIILLGYIMDKIKEYLQKSFHISHRQIVYILNISASYFS